MSLTTARHPLLEREAAVPLDIQIGGPTSVVLITGPNTGGKTVAIKTVGLAVAMAQSGLMPVARECEIGCFSQIWADIGDEQSLEQSLSTFSGHIKNVAAALTGLRPGALVLLDEVGAGTDPTEGASLARALLLAFQQAGAVVMASTHFGELKLLAGEEPGFENASMEFDVKSLRPTYRLLLGVPGSSHALSIAERYGIPKPVVEAAKAGIGQVEHDVAALISRLEQAQRQAQRAQGDADRVSARLRQVEEEAVRKIEAAEEARLKVRERATAELEALLREIRLEAADIFDELKKDPSQRGFERARRRLKDLQSVGQELAAETAPAAKPSPKAAPSAKSLARGDTVKIDGLSQTGVLLDEPTGRQAQVQVGPMRMTVEVAKLTRLAPAAPAKPQHRAGGDKLRRVMTAATELHLRQMRAEDAELELSKFLDEAILAGLSSVRIVHGKGEGILRKLTHDVLRRHKGVRSHSLADPTAGGDGVTIAELR